MPVSLPLNANDEVRAVTSNCGIFASRLSSSSEIPSEKYSWSFPADMSTNGSTAMLFSGMAVSDVVGLRETIMKAATIAPSTSSPYCHCGPPDMRPMFLNRLELFGQVRITDFIGVEIADVQADPVFYFARAKVMQERPPTVVLFQIF